MRGKEIKKERKNHENVCGMLAFQHLQYTSVFQDIPKQIVLFLKTNYEQTGLLERFRPVFVPVGPEAAFCAGSE
jgi:hypothetical protein